eukprot:Nitzschia sp. Nitz4//scaffold155_size52807//46639//49418//NITZ4_006803-RA/size52807-processed-gene-0.10-mRNA-1//1//CDS//3329537390//6957//frame0
MRNRLYQQALRHSAGSFSEFLNATRRLGNWTSATQNVHSLPTKKQATGEKKLPVWFTLWRNGELAVKADKVSMEADSNIADLKHAVKGQLSNRLRDVDAPDLAVYEPQAVDEIAQARFKNGEFGTEIVAAGSPVPHSTLDTNPIVVVAPNNLSTPIQRESDKLKEKKLPVWFTLWRNGELAVKVEKVSMDAGSDISDLKHAVKGKLSNRLRDVDTPNLAVYEPQTVDEIAQARFKNGEFGTEVVANRDVPDTRYECPVLVVAPKSTTSDSGTGPTLKPFDLLETPLLPLRQVPTMPMGPLEPKHFCAPTAGWLDDRVKEIMIEATKDDVGDRCEPVAFIRCSRGGKSRTLKEIQYKLHGQTFGNTVMNAILVSFNDFSSVEDLDRRDPLRALCRRIAFAAMAEVSKDNKKDSATFDEKARFLDVNPDQIVTWLGDDTPCVLLIDELNVLLDRESTPADKNADFARFLKKHFLAKKNRCVVFTSHISTEAHALSSFMDSVSSRNVQVSRLPTIANLNMARDHLGCPNLTPTEALYCGRIPALLWEKNTHSSFNAHTDRLNRFEQRCDDELIRQTLKTYIEGDVSRVPTELLPLMDVVKDEQTKKEKIVWVLWHMWNVLDHIQKSQRTLMSKGMLENCGTLGRLLLGLDRAKPKSGNAWESLFCATLLIRLITGSFGGSEEKLLPLPASFRNCRVSFNTHFKKDEESDKELPHLSAITRVEEFTSIISPPLGTTDEETQQLYPHVVLYKPPHSSFKVYDIILVAYESVGSPETYFGYQLKEGYCSPASLHTPNDRFSKSFLVCGSAPHKPRKGVSKSWIVASSDEVKSFLGDSGSVLEPKQWQEFALQRYAKAEAEMTEE